MGQNKYPLNWKDENWSVSYKDGIFLLQLHVVFIPKFSLQ